MPNVWMGPRQGLILLPPVAAEGRFESDRLYRELVRCIYTRISRMRRHFDGLYFKLRTTYHAALLTDCAFSIASTTAHRGLPSTSILTSSSTDAPMKRAKLGCVAATRPTSGRCSVAVIVESQLPVGLVGKDDGEAVASVNGRLGSRIITCAKPCMGVTLPRPIADDEDPVAAADSNSGRVAASNSALGGWSRSAELRVNWLMPSLARGLDPEAPEHCQEILHAAVGIIRFRPKSSL